MRLHIVIKNLYNPLKSYFGENKTIFKNNWLFAGIIYVLLILIASILFLLDYELFAVGVSSISTSITLLLYGQSSYLIFINLLEIIGSLILFFLIALFCFFIRTTIQYAVQDTLKNELAKVSFSSVFKKFKQLNKNQVLRLFCYFALFIFLWLLPLLVIHLFTSKIEIVTALLQFLFFVVLLWKGIDYSQALFLYRENQPQFLGQSQRYALKASKRFIRSLRFKYLLLLIGLCIPLAVWIGLWSIVTYFGFYIWEPIMIYGGPFVGVIGGCFYLPFVQFTLAYFYEKNNNSDLLEKSFRDCFKPVGKLTGEAYKN